MKKLPLLTILMAISFITYNCSVADDVKETFGALECANLIKKIDEEYEKNDPNCAELRSDISKIEKTCNEFLTEEQKEQFAFIKANCEDAN